MKNFFTTKCSLAILTCALALTFTASASGSVFSGKVSLESGISAKDATIELVNSETLQTKSIASADENGEYTIVSEDIGTMFLRFKSDGFLTAKTSNIIVSENSKFVEIPDATLIAGDIDFDGKISMQDKLWYYRVSTFGDIGKSNWLKKSTDFDKNSITDSSDLEYLVKNLGKSSPTINISASNVKDVRRNNYGAYNTMNESGFTARTNADPGTMQSGWTYDIRGGIPKATDDPPYPLTDISNTEGVAHVRDLVPQTQGVMVFKTTLTIIGNSGNGAGIMFFDDDEEPIYELYTEGGYYCIRNKNGELVSLGYPASENTTESVVVVVDLENDTSHTYISGEDLGVYDLAASTPITGFKFFTGEEPTDLTLIHGAAYAEFNYSVKETFEFAYSNNQPFGWEIEKTSDAEAKNHAGDYVLQARPNDSNPTPSAKAYVPFDRIAGKIIFETIAYQNVQADGFCITLKYNDTDAVKLYTDNAGFYANGVLVRDEYLVDFWNTLRIVSDTDTNTAQIYFNGQKKATVDFLQSVPYINGLEISFAPDNTEKGFLASTKLDNVKLYQSQEVSDYVPAPVVPKDSDGYYVGINMCAMWTNGSHMGWDNITPFDEIKTIFGYYDEFETEFADWQIKLMAEHGIDFQLDCVYMNLTGNTTCMKPPGLSFFHSEYAEYMDYAMLWETGNASIPATLEEWKNEYVPFFVEYYLSNPNYAQIDGKAIIALFGIEHLREARGFGDETVAREALDYLEEVCKTLGYPNGCLYITNSTSGNSDYRRLYERMGADATYAYNYGSDGAYVSNTKSRMTGAYNCYKNLHFVPTISTGFNYVAWGGTRTPVLSASGMNELADWVKNTVFKSSDWYGNATENWKKKLVMLSSWNEYGEGTYMAPSPIAGYGYLDAVKKYFTDNNTSCNDLTPTANQLSRIQHLFPQDRQILRPLLKGIRTMSTISSGNSTSDTILKIGTNCTLSGGTATAQSDGSLKIVSTSNDLNLRQTNIFPFDAPPITGLEIYAKIPKGTPIQVYFTTDTSPSESESKSVKIYSDSDDWKSYYLETSGNSYWNGNITSLRYDITDKSGVTFYIKNVKTMGDCHVDLYIDGNEYRMTERDYYYWGSSGVTTAPTTIRTEPSIQNGNTLIPFYVDHGFTTMLKIYYTWDKTTGALRLRGHGADVTYTMGSTTALVNGTAQTLTCKPQLEDGLPMIPIEHYLEQLGDGFTLTKTITNNGYTRVYNITTPWNDYYSYESSADTYLWNFNQDGNPEGWAGSAATSITVIDGELTGAPGGDGDPILNITDLNINPAEYDKMLVRMKSIVPSNVTNQIYFLGNIGTVKYGASEERTIRSNVKAVKNGQYVDYIFDLGSHELYHTFDTITGFRFDPINASSGSFSIDKIQLLKTDSAMKYDTTAELSTIEFANCQNVSVTNNVLTATAKAGSSSNYDPIIYLRNLQLDPKYYDTVDITLKYTLTNAETSKLSLYYVNNDMSIEDWRHAKHIDTIDSDGANYRTYSFDMSNEELWNQSDIIKTLRFDPIDGNGSFSINNIRIYNKNAASEISGYADFANLPEANMQNKVITTTSLKADTKANANGQHDPQFTLGKLHLPTGEYNAIDITMKFSLTSATESVTELYFMTDKMTGFSGSYFLEKKIIPEDGEQFVTYTYDMRNNAKWNETGVISGLRIDPINHQGSFEITSIRLYNLNDKFVYDTDEQLCKIGAINVEQQKVENGVYSADTEYLNRTGSKYDPILTLSSLGFATSEYNAVDITLKYTLSDGTEATTAEMYFVTDAMSGEAATHMASIPLVAADGTEFKTYTFDFSQNALWADAESIKRLRIDPINCGGHFEIDSIKIYKK